MYYILLLFHLIASIVLILVVLLQSGKAGDLASAFGGTSSQTAFGARSAATVLTKATAAAAIVFVLYVTRLGDLLQPGFRVDDHGLGEPRHAKPTGCNADSGCDAADAGGSTRAIVTARRWRPAATAGDASSGRRRGSVGLECRSGGIWQTHHLEGVAPVRVCGFKSRLRHQPFHPFLK